MGNIIYERRYPREDAEGIEALSKTLDKETEETQQIPTFEEFLRRVYENQVCILIPERQRLAEKFIRTACEVSKLYRLDIKITQYSDHISVDYYFNAVGGLRYLFLPTVWAMTLLCAWISTPTPYSETGI